MKLASLPGEVLSSRVLRSPYQNQATFPVNWNCFFFYLESLQSFRTAAVNTCKATLINHTSGKTKIPFL